MLLTKHRLPCLVALAAAFAYGLTLCWGTTTNSLALTANVAGWDWQPLIGQPVTWLLTLPLRALPAAWIPAGLNLLFALCAAVTLGLLARSVELLPWDCQPPENNDRARRMPVLLAVGACGLEINFWQEATAGAGAMLDLLLLAAAIWCLLEYRVARNTRWLNAAAVIWGLGLAQSWVMQLYLPMFVATLMALRGWHFFRLGFLLRIALFGLAGFSIYALPPLVNGLNPHSVLSFGAGWLASLKASKSGLLLPYYHCWAQNRMLTLVVVLFYLVPILPALVRLPDRGSNNKSSVDRLQMRIYRIVRAALLLACLWLAFEPSVGPQQSLRHKFGVFLPLLSFDYLNALGIAFLAGNLLFALQIPPEPGLLRGLARRINLWRRRSVPWLFAGAFALILVALAFRNAPVIWCGNRQPLEKFGTLVTSSLPAEGGILIGDDADKLAAAQAALAHTSAGRWQVVLLPLLPSPEYRAMLERQQPLGWLTEVSRHPLSPPEQFRLLEQLVRARRIFGLQPVAGQLLLELFCPEPVGAVTELKLYEPLQFSGPPLSPIQLDAGEKFWDAAWASKMAALVVPVAPRRSAWHRLTAKLDQRLILEPVMDLQSRLLANWEATALDEWGVQLQRNGRFAAAQRRFEQALALQTNNLAAAANLECNTNLQAGAVLTLAGLERLAATYPDLAHFTRAIGQFGPIDQPAVCFLFGNECQLAGLPRQALQQLSRASALAPAELRPKLALAEIYSRHNLADQVVPLVTEMRAALPALSTNDIGPVALELDLLEAKAWMARTNVLTARRLLQSILDRHPQDLETQDRVLAAYLSFGDLSDVLEVVTRRLAAEPDNLDLLNRQAGILIEMDQATKAIAVLNRALAITNTPMLRLNLAGAYWKSTNLPAARAEYQKLEADPPDVFIVHFGLANIAEMQHETNQAIRHWEICLTNAPVGSAGWGEARTHLAALRPAISGPAGPRAPGSSP